MNSGECTLTNSFGQAIQVLLAFLVLIVLSVEYAWEILDAQCRKKPPKRDAIQFWFDVFKISCGAALSHAFNVLVAMFLSTKSEKGDECALYALAFVYETSGVPFVQLLTYCVIKFAETRAAISTWWEAVSRPGLYNHQHVHTSLSTGETKFKQTLLVSLFLSLCLLALGLIFGWGFLVTYVGPVFTFMFVFTLLYTTYEAKVQVFTWCCIKVFEKGVWTGFVVVQAGHFERWSRWMELRGNPHLEAIFYVCLIPIVMNAFMFFMFSRISRLQLPCFSVDKKVSGERQTFDLREAFKVGVVFCAMVNTVIWLGCWLAFRRAEVGLVLFLSVLVIPLIAGTCCVFVGRWVVQTSLSWQRGDRRFYQKAEEGSSSCELGPRCCHGLKRSEKFHGGAQVCTALLSDMTDRCGTENPSQEELQLDSPTRRRSLTKESDN